jgi:PKD domain-containing protein
MRDRSRSHAITAIVVSLAVVAAGCGSESVTTPDGPTEAAGPFTSQFPPGTIHTAPAGAIVGTLISLQSHIATVPPHYYSYYGSDPGRTYESYYWDFGDGTTAVGGESISHVYATVGVFVASVLARNSEGTSQQASSNIHVGSLTGRWSGDYGRVSITQDGLELRGYVDDSREVVVEGRVSMTGTVTFSITRPGLDPVTFTGAAGPNVTTLVGIAKGPNAVDRPWKLTRD